jgi:WD40 repeat protein
VRAIPPDEARQKGIVVREDAQMALPAWCGDGELVATVSTSFHTVEQEGVDHKSLYPTSTVKVWNARTGKLVKSLAEEQAQIFAVAFSPDGGLAAIAGHSFQARETQSFLRILDARSWQMKEELTEADVPEAMSLLFSPDGKTLAMGGAWDRTQKSSVWLWDVRNGKLKEGSRPAGAPPSEETAGIVRCLAFSPDGRTLAAAERLGRSSRTRIQLYDGQTAAPKRGWEIGQPRSSVGLAFTDQGKHLVGAFGPVKVWEVDTGKEVRALDTGSWNVHGLSVSADGRQLAGAVIRTDKDKLIAAGVLVWDAKTCELTKSTMWQEPGMWTSSVAFSPEGKFLAMTGMTVADARLKDGDKTKGELRVMATRP